MIRRAMVLALLLAAGCKLVKVVPPEEPRPQLSEPTNMGFEKPGPSGGAENWYRTKSHEAYEVQLDEKVRRTGKRSALIAYTGGPTPQWGAWDQAYLGHPLTGKVLHVKGWLKTEGAEECPECAKAVDNDSLPEGVRRGAEIKFLLYPTSEPAPLFVSGTNDWTPFEFKASVAAGTDGVVLSLSLWGRGKVWFDDLTLTFE